MARDPNAMQIQISKHLRARIRQLQDTLRRERGRSITIAEALEYLCDREDQRRAAGGPKEESL